MVELRSATLDIWRAGLRSVAPGPLVGEALSGLELEGRVWIFALGKAALPMAQAARARFPRAGGLVITHDPSGTVEGLEVVVGEHPVPGAGSLQAAVRARSLAEGLVTGDHLVALISGGGSSLMADPAPPWTLEALARRTHELLAGGAPIEAINRFRIDQATLKGGRLGALAQPASVHTWVISDIEGQPELVASGPTAGTGPLVELASNQTARQAAALAAREAGWEVVLADPMQGEARDYGRALADRIRARPGPVAWIGGGECTVTVRGPGRGGRCQELALAASPGLVGLPVALLAAGTDGRDGPTEAAGALVDGHTGLRPGVQAALDASDSGTWLGESGSLLHLGPTGTNVGDLLVALRA